MKRCSQCKSLVPDDVARCVRCVWQTANTASAAPQPQEQHHAAAVEKGSRSSRMRILATVLTSPVFFLASCTGGFHIATAVTAVIENQSGQIPIDEANPPQHDVAIVATTSDPSSPGKKPLIYWLLKEPKADLAKFRLKYPGFSFLPPSDRGGIDDSHGETDVEYQVLTREPGKAVVKTHYRHYPILFTLDVRATYEATDSDIRLISYRSSSDSANGVFAGPLLAFLLAILGEGLKRRYVTPPTQKAKGKSQPSSRMRIAAVLTSNFFFVASCTGGMAIASVAMEPKDITIDQANPPTVAVVGTSVDPSSPANRRMEFMLVKECNGDLAKLRLENPGYSFLPPSDKGDVIDADPSVPFIEYEVLQRESGKALVKTHFRRKAPPFDFDTHATYEATDSDIRLISYHSGSDLGRLFFAGLILAILFAISGWVLKRRFATALDQESESESRPDTHWKGWLRTIAGALSIIGFVCGRTNFGLPLFAVAGLVWIALKWFGQKGTITGQS